MARAAIIGYYPASMNAAQAIGLCWGILAVLIPILHPIWCYRKFLTTSTRDSTFDFFLIGVYFIGIVAGPSTIVAATLRGFGVNDQTEIATFIGFILAIGIGKWQAGYLRREWNGFCERNRNQTPPIPPHSPSSTAPRPPVMIAPVPTTPFQIDPPVPPQATPPVPEEPDVSLSLRVRRERLLPALDHETSDEDISSLKNGSELKAHTAEAEDRWKVVADLYQRQVQAIAASQDLTGAPQVLDRRITFQGLSAPVKLAVLYKGNFQDGNAQILAVDGESVSSSLKGKIRIRISADGLRTVFFLLWGARSRGAMWHGYYNVPEGFIFREQALFETITNREEKDPLDPSLDTVLRVHAGFRITRCGERFRISCLGYRTNVGICDYWVEVDGDGWIADDGEIVLLKTSIRMFY